MGLATLYLFLVHMLLLEDVTYDSSVFESYVIVTILELSCFSYHICKLSNILLFVNSIVNIISIVTPCM